MKLKRLMTSMAFVAAGAVSASAVANVDPAIPAYTKVSGVSGNLSSVGSDTLANLMTLWAEAYKKQYPSVNIQIQAAGSSTAPPALTEGTANLGPMSRKMKDVELQAFEAKHGYKPTAIPVAVDALAVFVNKDNPIKGLTMEQVDGIFSANQQPGSASVVQSVSQSLNGIGYSGIGYKTSSVRALPLAKRGTTNFVEADEAHALDGTYPLGRFLYVYVNKAPNKPLQPLELEFVKLMLSQEGQQVVVKDGYIPVPAKVAAKTLEELSK